MAGAAHGVGYGFLCLEADVAAAHGSGRHRSLGPAVNLGMLKLGMPANGRVECPGPCHSLDWWALAQGPLMPSTPRLSRVSAS